MWRSNCRQTHEAHQKPPIGETVKGLQGPESIVATDSVDGQKSVKLVVMIHVLCHENSGLLRDRRAFGRSNSEAYDVEIGVCKINTPNKAP
jgi:hypothetical protein